MIPRPGSSVPRGTAALAGLLLTMACSSPVTMTFPDAGAPLTEDDVAFIEPGATSCEEVVLRLGTPFFAHDEERVLAYAWLKEVVTIHGILIPLDALFLNFEYPLSFDQVYLTHLYLVAWDEDGRVRGAGFATVESLPFWNTVDEALRTWSATH